MAIENQKKILDNNKMQYGRELDHMKEQLEESYTANKELEQQLQQLRAESLTAHKLGSKRSLQSGGVGLANMRVATTQTVGQSESNSQLEKNFLKLKELYETVYKANIALMRDQKDLKEKYSKLLREKGPRTSSRSLPRKEPEVEVARKPPIKMRDDSRGKLSSASQRTRSRDTPQQNSGTSSGKVMASQNRATPGRISKRPPAPGVQTASKAKANQGSRVVTRGRLHMDRFDDDDDLDSQSDQTDTGVRVGSQSDMLKTYGRYANDMGSKNTSMNTSKLREDVEQQGGTGETPSKRGARKGSANSQQQSSGGLKKSRGC